MYRLSWNSCWNYRQKISKLWNCLKKKQINKEYPQFTLSIPFRCILHRCRSQDIHCWELCDDSWLNNVNWPRSSVFVYEFAHLLQVCFDLYGNRASGVEPGHNSWILKFPHVDIVILLLSAIPRTQAKLSINGHKTNNKFTISTHLPLQLQFLAATPVTLQSSRRQDIQRWWASELWNLLHSLRSSSWAAAWDVTNYVHA